ncbi:MAG: PQQ-dependent sugar dehydrogenase [Armatimonadetes bacterium]|nr:PQQ-dependent sugar dehydrogenase [Armatimonadota bacterium]
MQKLFLAVLVSTAVVVCQAQITQSTFLSGLSRPIVLTQQESGSRIFVIEQRSGSIGRIRLVLNGVLQATPFLSVSPVTTGSEQGLLGMAFHPNFATNGYFYVNYTDSAGNTKIVRYQATAPYQTSTTATASSATPVMSIAQPYSNHNGGSLKFGPDGFLYIGTGDGGSGNDPENRAQNLTELLGKFLRIDVDRDDYPLDTTKNYGIPTTNPYATSTVNKPEIWSYGWRNPWQWNFDTASLGGFGGLWVADVGQNGWEEIDHEIAGSVGGLNYGWRVYEGTHLTGLGGGTGPFVNPLYEYSHGSGCSISGGVLYRGTNLGPANYGRYFFADYCTGQLWSVKATFAANLSATVGDFQNHITTGGLASVAADLSGELYGTTAGSTVLKFSGPGKAISGNVIFSEATAKSRRVTMELIPTAGGTSYNFDLQLPADGSFRIPALAASYRVAVKNTHWLRKAVTVDTTGGNVSGVNIVLTNGNSNADNVIDLSDYTIVITAFNALPPDPNWDVRADLNEDGVVDLTDYTIVVTNFNAIGD